MAQPTGASLHEPEDIPDDAPFGSETHSRAPCSMPRAFLSALSTTCPFARAAC
jgi:hypothetical protein